MKKIIFVLSLFGQLITWADSGGWVGNSPAIAVYTAQLNIPTYYSDEEAESKSLEWNSLLLPEGRSRFRAGMNYYVSHRGWQDYTFLSLGYDYAFTSEWTMFSLFNWGYSLKSGNGVGSEWALLFGLADGFMYSSSMGWSLGPGIGIAYAYSHLNWRFNATSMLSAIYDINSSHWGGLKLHTTFSITNWFNENWGGGISTSHLYRQAYRKDSYCGTGCTSYREIEAFNALTDPEVNLSLRFLKSHKLTLGFQPASDRNKTSLDYSYEW